MLQAHRGSSDYLWDKSELASNAAIQSVCHLATQNYQIVRESKDSRVNSNGFYCNYKYGDLKTTTFAVYQQPS